MKFKRDSDSGMAYFDQSIIRGEAAPAEDEPAQSAATP